MAELNDKVAKVGHLRTLTEQLNNKIKAQVAAAFHPAGSVAFVDLPELTKASEGLLFNVTDAFTTTEDFLEGAGKAYPAGTNVAVVKSGEAYKYDAMSGFLDTSGFVLKEDGKELSANDYTDTDKAKLDAIAEGANKVEPSDTPGNIKINGVETSIFQVATDEEINVMLDEVLGPSENA